MDEQTNDGVDQNGNGQEDCDKKQDLANPKRISRRINQSADIRNRARITPVLHRRKSSKTREETRPVPKPRQSVSRGGPFPEDSRSGSQADDEDVPELSKMVMTDQNCIDPDLFKDASLSVSMPLRMSYNEDTSKVDILEINYNNEGSISSGTEGEEDGEESDDTLPTVRETSNGHQGKEDDQEITGEMLCNPDTPVWSPFDGRPRTNCGRPLTGERRPDSIDRPPTRSGRVRDVAASYSFERSRGELSTPVQMRSTMDASDFALNGGSQVKLKTKHRIIFKEIKSEPSPPIPRQQTPHVHSRNGMSNHMEDPKTNEEQEVP